MWKSGVFKKAGDFTSADWAKQTNGYLAGIKTKKLKYPSIMAALTREKTKVEREAKEERKRLLLQQRNENGGSDGDSESDDNGIRDRDPHANLPDSDAAGSGSD